MERALVARLSAGVAVAAIVSGVLWLWWGRQEDAAPKIPGEPGGITVEVLNTTTSDGLAREVTRRLRRAGIDVVYYGTDWTHPVDSTTILIRSGDSTVALRVRRVLGLGRLSHEPNPGLFVDATVLLGPDAARSLNLHP